MRYAELPQITSQFDIPTIASWLFILFFVGLVFWLQRESKREGYPLRASPFTDELMEGFPPPPEDRRTYVLNEGGTTQSPHYYEPGPTSAEPMERFMDGTAFAPVGNPLLAAIGPGAWVQKKNEPALTERGHLLLQPLAELPEWSIAKADADPRGMAVFDWRWNPVGQVTEVWIDTGIKIVRFLEVELSAEPNVRRLVPIYHTHILEHSRKIRVTALWAHQFAGIPMPAEHSVITGPEEERLNAYFAAGEFYRDSPLTAPAKGESALWSH